MMCPRELNMHCNWLQDCEEERNAEVIISVLNEG